ncbi:hypothetical protein GF339_15115 [candidate division KSB3 bacterium]|uniref:Uncharacterized protein n=1 Tax=candidate division KSB3 bacterium TaxID=2044937 RepID=A0A9D5JXG3_9BACT|nr:hypothetical protein [candidate division KSB3 bacterium]MBD3325915.1 hypothetical protein [candidate division KSB3 bacterium]
MTQSQYAALDRLTGLLKERLQSAQARVQASDSDHMQRYYKGQADTLHIVLRDIDAIKFEEGMELEALKSPKRSLQAEPSVPPKPPRTRKPRKRSRRSTATPPPSSFTYQALAQEAVNRGIIRQKLSHFYHDLLPEQHVKGYTPLYQAFEDNEVLRQAVQEALRTLDTETPPSNSEPSEAESGSQSSSEETASESQPPSQEAEETQPAETAGETV